MGPVPNAVAEDVDGAAFGDLALETGKEFAAGGTVFGETEGRGGLWLGGVQKGSKLDQIDAVLTIVVVVVAAGPADATVAGGWFSDGASSRRVTGIAGQSLADKVFEAAFGCVRRHVTRSVWILQWLGRAGPPRWPGRSLRCGGAPWTNRWTAG